MALTDMICLLSADSPSRLVGRAIGSLTGEIESLFDRVDPELDRTLMLRFGYDRSQN